MVDSVSTTPLSPRTCRRQWILVGLLITAAVVNYIDRSTLAIANHTIATEMHLSPSQMGLLLSAFAWAYAIAQMPVGFLTDRIGPRIMLPAAMVLWSIAQIFAGAVQNFTQFIAARIGLGLGESPMFTAGARAIVDWFPVKDRGVPLGLFNAASSLGPAIAPPLLTGLMLAFGWRPMFVLMGIAGLLVAAAWWLSYRSPERAGVSPAEIAAINAGNVAGAAEATPRIWAQLFAIPTTWAMIGGLFGIVYVTWLNVAWLPDYLETVRHVTVADTGYLAAIPQFAGFVGGVLGGFLADGLAHRGVDPIESRKLPTVVGLVFAGVFTAIAPFAATTAWQIALMSAAMFFAYGAGSTSWALGASLTPPHLVATFESIQNVGGSLGGSLAPLVTGLIVENTHSFIPAFLVAAVASIASAVSYALVRRNAYQGLGGATEMIAAGAT